MLKKNEEYIVEIIDNGYQGEGIAKIDGITVFIDQAIKGEKIKIKIIKVSTNFCYGKILEILEEAKERVEPDCKTYKKCGGCSLRHIEYAKTLDIKKDIVQNCLYKTLKKEIKVEETIGMKNPLYYRNKLQYPVGLNEEGNPVMGVYSSRTHDVVETKECFIQNKTCQEIANDIFGFIEKNKISVYNEKTLKGTVRHIIVRIGMKTNEVLVTIVVSDNNFKKEKELVELLTSKYKEIKSIVKNINSENTNVILGEKDETIYGDGYIYDVLGNYKFKISAKSFYQTNPIQTEVLYNTAVKQIKTKGKEKIAIDLYSGIGTIGIFASSYFKKVYGVEIVEEAIEDARENAKINDIKNIEFIQGDVENTLPEILEKEKIEPDVIFVDPPRKGLDNNTITKLLEIKPKQIIYISCNPATLARDLSKLEEVYEIKKVQPVDMFPYTKHIETVSMIILHTEEE